MRIYKFYIIFIIGLFLSYPVMMNTISSSNGQVQQNLRIVLKQPLQSIGADAGDYPIYIEIQDSKGEAVELNNDLNIKLYSSDTRVGEVPSEVVLKSGSFYTIVDFKSTETPGSTIITAMASGFQTGTLLIKTDYSVGYPKRLMVYIYPNKLLPALEDANIVVELQDILGKPARAPEDIKVNLFSSNTLIGDVLESEVTISKGETYVITKFRPTNIPGSTVITASASGYESSRATVSTVGPTPEKIVVTAAPSKLPSNGVDKSYIYVTAYLVDSQGYPARSDKDITVTFTSSDTSLGYFKIPQMVIHAGEFSVQDKLYSSGVNLKGVVEITAQAKSLKSSTTDILVLSQSNKTKGSLKVYGAPPIFPPGENIYDNSIIIQIEDSGGNPIVTTKQIKVYLSSSDTLYGDVTQDYTFIFSGSSIGVVGFNTTKLVGNTTITASADDFTSSDISMGTYAPPPVKLTLGIGPPNIRASGDSYPFLYVQLQDELGRPATAQEDVLVDLSSSNEEYGKVPSNIIIENGDSFEYISFTSTSFPGETNITASAGGYETDILLVKTIEPFPSILASVAYTTYIACGGTYPLYIQLLDSMGRPAKPELPIQISLISSNPDIIDVASTVTLDEGSPYAVVQLTTSESAGKATISVAASGYTPASLTLESIVLPLHLNIVSSKSSIEANESLELTVSADSLGMSIKDVDLSISSENGNVVSNGKTDKNGLFKFTYIPLKPGDDVIKVLGRKPGYVDAYAEYKIYVDKHINLRVRVRTSDGLGVAGLNITVTDGEGVKQNAVSDSSGLVYVTNLKWGNITVSVENNLTEDGVRYLFIGWNDGQKGNVWKGYLENDTEVVATYKVKYYISVVSPYSNTYGSGWYDEGISISIGVEETMVPVNFIQSKKFDSWSGDVVSNNPEASVIVNSPKKITAVWVDDYTRLYYLIAGIIAVIVVIVLIVLYYKGIILKRFRRKAVEEEESGEGGLTEWETGGTE